ncbi:MAG TPA: hypothetical protein PLB02_13520, partial [Thermoanaerobaculia bacterium]|nr:hypothetical protein [Thermoanaerobaculia bacterium]
RAAATVFAGVGVLLLFEQRVAPLELFRGTADPDPLTRKLATLPMKGGIVELPSSADQHGNYEYVLRAADHAKPLVNGVSGFNIPIVQKLEELTAMQPIPEELLDLLESIPASYVTVREAWLTQPQRAALRDFLGRGAASGRLRYVGRFDRETAADLWAVSKTEPSAVSLEPPPWRPRAPGVPLAKIVDGRRIEPLLAGGLDDLPDGGAIRGPLVVRGWARIPGEDLEVRILIDGEERPGVPVRRYDRPDVCAALPRMADCRSAGFEARFDPTTEDEGKHEVTAVFLSRDGRFRVYPPARITWTP